MQGIQPLRLARALHSFGPRRLMTSMCLNTRILGNRYSCTS